MIQNFLTIPHHSSERYTRAMIRGIGVDIVSIGRIRESVGRFGNSFLTKVFTAGEIRFCQSSIDPSREFAFCFSAKESLSKALATGYSDDFRWHNVEVTCNATGRHSFLFHNAAEERLRKSMVRLSLSCTGEMVVAFVVIYDP